MLRVSPTHRGLLRIGGVADGFRRWDAMSEFGPPGWMLINYSPLIIIIA